MVSQWPSRCCCPCRCQPFGARDDCDASVQTDLLPPAGNNAALQTETVFLYDATVQTLELVAEDAHTGLQTLPSDQGSSCSHRGNNKQRWAEFSSDSVVDEAQGKYNPEDCDGDTTAQSVFFVDGLSSKAASSDVDTSFNDAFSASEAGVTQDSNEEGPDQYIQAELGNGELRVG